MEKMIVIHTDGTKENFKPRLISQTIIDETGIGEDLALRIQDRITKKIYKLRKDGLDEISTSAIRAEVSSQLLKEKEFGAEKKNRKLGMSVQEFEDLLANGNKDNANIFFSPELVAKYAYDSIAKEHALLTLPNNCSDAYKNGYIHIHDMEYFQTRSNCANWSIPFIARNGLKIDGKGEYGSVAGPAKSIEVLLNQMLEFLMCGSLVLSGGQSYSGFNVYLAPFAKGRTYKDIKQAIQNFIFNSNCALIAKGQTIFSSINIEFEVPDFLKNEPAVGPNGVEVGVYGDYENEVKMIFKAIIEVTKEKDYNGRFHTFPNQIYMIREHTLDTYNEEVKMVHELLSENPTIYFSNVSKEDAVTMGCLGKDETIIIKTSDNIIKSVKIGEFVEDCLLIDDKVYGNSHYSEACNSYSVLSMNKEEEWEWKPVLKAIRNPKEDIYNVKLSGGNVISCTEDHPFLVGKASSIKHFDGGKQLKLFEESDRLVCCKKNFSNNIEENYIGTLIGFVLGDGTISHGNSISIAVEKKSKIKYLKEVFSKINFLNVKIIEKDKNTNFILLKSKQNNNYGKDFIDDLIIMKKSQVLDKYLKDLGIIKGIIAGLINSDGYIHVQSTPYKKNNLSLQISNTNINIINFCMNYGNLFGLKFSKYLKQTPIKKSHNPCWDLKVGGEYAVSFLDSILLQDIHKESFNKANHDCQHINKNWQTKLIKGITIDENYNDYVYDIEVEDNHNFICNGAWVLSSNCRTRMSKTFTGDYEQDCMNVGNFHYVSINLPLIAHESSNKKEFFDTLKKYMEISREVLLERKKWVEDTWYNKHMSDFLLQKDIKTGKQLYEIERCSFSIGICGLNECCLELTGNPIQDEQELGEEICQYMTDVLNEFKAKDGLRWTLFYSPAESAAHRFALINKEKYPDAYVNGTEGNYYLTNSHHIDVKSDVNLVQHIKNGDIFHKYGVAGGITHIWMSDTRPDPIALFKLNQRIAKTNIKFWAFTNDYTYCLDCGFTILSDEDECLICHSDNVVTLSRITGYYQPVSGYNNGKKQEFKDRYRHKSVSI